MKNILLVDDEKKYLLSLSEGLRQCDSNFNVLTAENGMKAIDILSSTRIDLLITDLKMPVMDGFDLLMHVLKKHHNMPVIIATAFSNPDVIEKLRSLGFLNYIEKPMDFDDLLDNIHSLFDSK